MAKPLRLPLMLLMALAAVLIGPGDGYADGNEAKPTNPTITQHDVIPILLCRCTVCHGLHRQEGRLDLRTKAAMLHGGKSGPAIILGKPEESLLIQKCRSGQMPPRERLVEVSVKPIEASEIDTLVKWIAAGAPEVTIQPDAATTSPDPLVSDKDRDFWAFKPPRRVHVPSVRDSNRVRNPIDAFILQTLEQKDLTLAPEADPLTLLRRVYYDLTGLPPTPREIEQYLHAVKANPEKAYGQLIDRLLASPRYGERWARFWLDLAGYADSEGKREQDLFRPNAWRYRDYVIRSFNSDKRYDRFLLEQIAGDELSDYEHAPEITPEIYDNLVATGFLRMAPDATWANITDYVPDRLEVIADELDVLGSAVMGLTLKCARCHNHKFDPIPQRDYYRLLDVFKGAYDEHDWLKPDVRPGLGPVSQDFLGGRLVPFVTSAERRAWETQNAKIQREIHELESELDRKTSAWTAGLPKFLHLDRVRLSVVSDSFRKDCQETEDRIRALQSRRSPEPMIQALWDRGEPSPTYIYMRGDSLKPGRRVGPGVPSVLTDGHTPLDVKPPWPGAKKTGRRLAFAHWLTRHDHPLTARVEVNRLWQRHFGTGIVATLGNFGRVGAAPSHPELLDWLACEFVQQEWSIKAIQRLMMLSATYRQSSIVAADAQRIDPANSLFSRMPLRRLDAEQLYDSLLDVAGRLDGACFGPADNVKTRGDGLVTPVEGPNGWRRLIYVKQMRKQTPTHLENFDFPQMNPNCLERRDSTVAPQALHLMNNGMVQQLAEQFSRRVAREAGADPAGRIERIYLIALSRKPNDEEREIALESLAEFTKQWARQTSSSGKLVPESARLKALATLCHAIMNSAAFLYVD